MLGYVFPVAYLEKTRQSIEIPFANRGHYASVNTWVMVQSCTVTKQL